MSTEQVARLKDCANRLRVTSIEITAAAKSGHPTSSASAAEIIATLFFHEMRYDVQKPRDPNADRFILSKGHACPVLYAAWYEAGLLSKDEIMKLRHVDSDIEGHPTPRLNFIDVATGSLGQGLSVACGMAVAGKKYDKASYRTYCLLGDGETAEGSVWEAAAFASYYNLDNLIAIVDINRLGQSRATALDHDSDTYARRFAAFGWHTIKVNGHEVNELLKAYEEANNTKGKPIVILAQTFKGHGIDGVANGEGFHGKPVELSKADPIREQLKDKTPQKWNIQAPIADGPNVDLKFGSNKLSSPPGYKLGEEVATRKAYGTALVKLVDNNKRIVALDGDVSNSTFSEMVAKKYPEQYVECFIAEQNMVGVGVGLGCRQRTIPFVSTFAAFFTRAADQIRMAAVSMGNVKFCGSHVGVSIGDDGPSQMGLEDIALFRALPDAIVFYPSDAVSTERATELAANQPGIVFIRTGRPNVPVIYGNEEKFEVGKSKIVKKSDKDSVLIVAAGITLHESLKAQKELEQSGIHAAVLDVFSVKPLDVKLLESEAKRCGGRVVTVEDHYQAGGLGEAVTLALAGQLKQHKHLCVRELPRSGAPDALVDRYGLSARHIVRVVKELTN